MPTFRPESYLLDSRALQRIIAEKAAATFPDRGFRPIGIKARQTGTKAMKQDQLLIEKLTESISSLQKEGKLSFCQARSGSSPAKPLEPLPMTRLIALS